MSRPRETLARIVAHLQTVEGEVRAGDLAEALSLSPSRLSRAAEPGVEDGQLVRRQEGRGTWYSLGTGVAPDDEPEDDDAGEFTACLWTDGELDLHGIVELEGGGVRIPAAGVRLLCRLLHGQGPADA